MVTSLCVCIPALLFGGKVKVNPAHPKQIGSIDPNCRVSEVIRGENVSLIEQTFYEEPAVTECSVMLFFKYSSVTRDLS